MGYEYTIATCNYNMVETVHQSMESILKLTTKEFEILVVDGGSTDGSLRKLRDMSSQYDRLRVINTTDHHSKGLGADRNVAVREAKGDYILTQLDADDKYYRGIQDFVTIYNQLRSELDYDFYLKGDNINIAEKMFLLEYGPYREGLTRGEDRDLWRRLFSDDAIIWLRHQPISHSIGYNPNKFKEIQYEYDRRMSDFRSGISFRSFVNWAWQEMSIAGFTFHTLLGIFAYIQARNRGIYEGNGEYTEMGELNSAISDHAVTLSELESQLDISIRRDLTKVGIDVFYNV